MGLCRRAVWGMVAGLALMAAPVRAQSNSNAESWSGYAEGGYSISFPAQPGSQFFLDNLEMRRTWKISDATHVHVEGALGVYEASTTAANAFGRAFDSVSYYPSATLTSAAPLALAFGVRQAFVDHRFAAGVRLAVGAFRTPFGMEHLWSRYDMHSYYYSMAYGTAQTLGWNYETGLRLALDNLGAGKLEVALFNTFLSAGHDTLGTALRYRFEVDGGPWTLTPVLSAYAGRWQGGPQALGGSLGALWKMGGLFFNTEFLYVAHKSPAKNENWSLWVEPGFDLGFATLSVKCEFTDQNLGTGSRNDMNVAAALSRNWGKFRSRLTYYHANLSNKLGPHANEVRLLFGTHW